MFDMIEDERLEATPITTRIRYATDQEINEIQRKFSSQLVGIIDPNEIFNYAVIVKSLQRGLWKQDLCDLAAKMAETLIEAKRMKEALGLS